MVDHEALWARVQELAEKTGLAIATSSLHILRTSQRTEN
jgi:hypothetical protein